MHGAFSLKRLQALEARTDRLNYIAKKFPNLYFEAHENLWHSCLYFGQMSLKCLPKDEMDQALKMIDKIMNEYPLSKEEMRKLSFSYKLWGKLTKISLIFTCRIRNILNVGF